MQIRSGHAGGFISPVVGGRLTVTEDERALADVRISIGIGAVILRCGSPVPPKGGFVLSGRGLDEIQKTERRLIDCQDRPIADIGLAGHG